MERLSALAIAIAVVLFAAAAAAGTAVASSATFEWSAPRLVDHAIRFAHPAVVSGLSCPSATLCVGVGSAGSIVTSVDPIAPGDWNAATVDPGSDLESVSCPTTSFCAAVADSGDLLTSTNPTGGTTAWNRVSKLLTNPQTGIGGISCPTASLCVAVNGGSDILASTDPTGGATAWSTRTIAGFHQFDGVSCPTVSLCVVVDFDGQIVTSIDPTGGASAWTDVSPSFGGSALLSVSCRSVSLCVATDDAGEVLVSQNPAGGVGAWTAVKVDGTNTISAVSCVAEGPCVAGDTNGGLIASGNPSGGAKAWTVDDAVDPSGFDSVGCQSATLCLAGDAQGSVAVSTAPAASDPVWLLSPQLGAGTARRVGLTGISCPSISFCAAADGAGDTVSTVRPGEPAAAWKLTAVNPGWSISAISCPSSTFCAAVGGDFVGTTVNPAGGLWSLADLELTSLDNNGDIALDSLTAIGCASSALCVATRYSYGADNLEVSRDPLEGAATWQPEALGQFDYDFFQAMSCPTASVCVAADAQGGTVAVSTDGAKRWKFTYVEAKSAMNGSLTPAVNDVSCPTRRFCAGVDNVGNVITTRDPSGAAKAWHRARPDGGHNLSAISCASASFCAVLEARQGGQGRHRAIVPLGAPLRHLHQHRCGHRRQGSRLMVRFG